MSCICSTALADRPGEPGVLTAIGADSAPGAHRGSGRLAAARSATAAIAAKKTMASVMLGVIEFFITHFLSYGTAVAAVLPCRRHRSARHLHALDSDGGRRPPDSGTFTGPVRPAVYGPWPWASGVRARARGVHLLSLAGPGRADRPGTGPRLGPDHIWVPRVGRRVLRPGALAAVLAGRARVRFVTRPAAMPGGWPRAVPAVFGRLCCAGAGGEANSSSATARAQRIRSTAASGWSPNSWATRWTHPKPR